MVEPATETPVAEDAAKATTEQPAASETASETTAATQEAPAEAEPYEGDKGLI